MHSHPIRLTALLILAATLGFPASAELWLPSIIGDHMVLQRDADVALWGRADAGSTVKVTAGDEVVEGRADAEGAWRVTLSPLPASSEPMTIAIEADGETRTLSDILVGEVWLCSGQSNMGWPLRAERDADIEIASSDYPRVRLFQVDHKTAQMPRLSAGAQWRPSSPSSAQGFSAVGYLFGRDLHRVLDCPVGLIDSSWGGTPAEAWTRVERLAEDEATAVLLTEWEEKLAQYPELFKTWKQDMKAWEEGQKTGLNPPASSGGGGAGRPRQPKGPDSPHRPGSLANGMLGPVVPYTLRGAIWYQGESNAGRYDQYRVLLPMMIRDWRDRWGQGDFPFGIVQLAGFMAVSEAPSDPPWAHLRDAQLQTAQTVSNVGFAVATDIGEANDIHPRNKYAVGRRLARWALADVYAQEILGSGPRFAGHKVEGHRVLCTFDHQADGLKVLHGGKPDGFIIAGEDRVWHWADAELVGKDRVAVWSPEVPNPAAVRYAWANNPVRANLVNSSQLPAAAFRTDDWPRGE